MPEPSGRASGNNGNAPASTTDYGKTASFLAVGVGLTGVITYAYFLIASHTLVDPLRHHPLPGEQVADDAEGKQLHGSDEEDGAEDQRLDVAAIVAVEDPVEQEGQPGGQRQDRHHQPGAGEDPQRLVAGAAVARRQTPPNTGKRRASSRSASASPD